MKTLIAAALLLALAAPTYAAPAQKWFLTVRIYQTSPHGHTFWDAPDIVHLNHAFDTRDECEACAFRRQVYRRVPASAAAAYTCL